MVRIIIAIRASVVLLTCIISVFALSMRANATPSQIHTTNNAILNVTFIANQTGDNVIKLRLRRAIRGHGHLNSHRTVHITAYDADGIMLAQQDKTIGKRQTYARLTLSQSFSGADLLTISLD